MAREETKRPTLGIDYGECRVGVAFSLGYVPRALAVLPHGDMVSLVKRIVAIAEREGAEQIVVGWPLNADGTEGEQARKSRTFAEALAAATSLPVYLWDERFTSQEALHQMIAAGTRRKARRHRLDAVAAALILQDFFEQAGVSARRVSSPGTKRKGQEE
ncbi:MAG: Holliday junction resolvase RuvX [Ardenticatenia bacterium]|nr:Holliday junction resolvase RuvX [Ardenticatenia bacterium]